MEIHTRSKLKSSIGASGPTVRTWLCSSISPLAAVWPGFAVDLSLDWSNPLALTSDQMPDVRQQALVFFDNRKHASIPRHWFDRIDVRVAVAPRQGFSSCPR